jgi:putative ribosome biogenesis GTPase RsgA
MTRCALAGEVVSAHGRHYVVELDHGSIIECYPRGKKSLVACGDRVWIQPSAKGQGVIEAVDPRRTLLYRSDPHRQKLIAANVTQLAVVVASAPSFYDDHQRATFPRASGRGRYLHRLGFRSSYHHTRTPLPNRWRVVHHGLAWTAGVWACPRQQEKLTDAFPEFRPYLSHCRFTNCQHLREPGCEITAASSRAIHPERLLIYQKLSRELADAARVF